MTRPTLRLISSSYNAKSAVGTSVAQPRVTISRIEGMWRTEVMQRLEELIRLEHGWDGYQGQAVSLENAVFALSMLDATCEEDTPPPQIIPGASGDLQIEWHTIHGDVELLVRGPNNVRAWRNRAGFGEDGEEVELTNDFFTVATWVKEAAEPTIVIQAAA